MLTVSGAAAENCLKSFLLFINQAVFRPVFVIGGFPDIAEFIMGIAALLIDGGK